MVDIIKDLDWISNRISERVWTISVGVLAFCLTFIVESISATGEPFLKPVQVIGPMILALISLICDLVQYMAAYTLSRQLLSILEAKNLNSGKYDPGSSAFKIREFSFRAKTSLCVLAAAWLIWAASIRTAGLIAGGQNV